CGPSFIGERGQRFLIARYIAPDFSEPVVFVGSWHTCSSGTIMTVPKTPMNKNYLSVTGKDNVGLSGKVRPMQPISIAHAVQEASNGELWLCIARLDRTHNSTALSGSLDHCLKSIFMLGSVSTSSMISL